MVNNNNEIVQLRAKLLDQAITLGINANLKLDFSDSSISRVENFLSQLHDEYIKTGNDEGLHGLAIIMGFYIIEVIERNHGKGQLERNHPHYGENTFTFFWNNNTIFPVAWCQKRIFDGDADNVETKYKAFIKERD